MLRTARIRIRNQGPFRSGSGIRGLLDPDPESGAFWIRIQIFG